MQRIGKINTVPAVAQYRLDLIAILDGYPFGV